MSHNDMELPAGKTCADCAFYKRCWALFECPATNTWCDWAPSRFRQRVVDLCAHGFPRPCSLCSGDNELEKMLRLRKELDPDAPDMIVFKEQYASIGNEPQPEPLIEHEVATLKRQMRHLLARHEAMALLSPWMVLRLIATIELRSVYEQGKRAPIQIDNYNDGTI